MNKSNLKLIFKKYIDNFEFINNSEHNENYKWEIIKKFQSFDLEAAEFDKMLFDKWKLSSNLVDSAQQFPFKALVEYAKEEPETVREMFRKLYADKDADILKKQKMIDEFISESEQLRLKYSPDSRLYVNNQRSVMMYLFLRFPNENYGYKASQAKRFAECIEFYDDWGPMTDFKMDVFYKMCDEVLNEIKQDDALIKTHRSRYEHTERDFYADENLHILLNDIIFSSQTYDFYDGITFNPINAQARKLYFERVDKARTLEKALEKAKCDEILLAKAREYFCSVFNVGSVLRHKMFGEVKILENDGTFIRIDKSDKKIGMFLVILNGIIFKDDQEFTHNLELYRDVMKREYDIPKAVLKAQEDLQPYLEYLD